MVRTYVRKTARGQTAENVMHAAVMQVVVHSTAINIVARNTGIPRSTLQRYVKMSTEGQLHNYKSNFNHRQVFSCENEEALLEYLITSSKMYHGLSCRDTRRLAYQFAMRNEDISSRMPQSWKVNEMAGEDWLTIFLKRHDAISLRKPEATSLARATAFNKTTVGGFFDKYEEVQRRYNFGPESIYNVDETGITTVHVPGKVIAQKGVKQTGHITSAERGTLVTMCACVNALGNAIAPMFIFPRVHFKEYMLNEAPTGSIGTAHPSGWMTKENFFIFMAHFIKQTKCSKEKKVLLLLDNHDSHISIDVVDLCRDNGIVLLTLPPHCSHKLQPLDRTTFGAFKRYYNAACNSEMLANPGQTITIYKIAKLAGVAFPKAFTPITIKSGFRVSGCFPIDRDVFSDDEFLTSYVTDRPIPNTEQAPAIQPDPVISIDGQVTRTLDEHAGEGCSGIGSSSCSPQQVNQFEGIKTSVYTSPSDVRPYPKAAPRKQINTGRKRAHCRILTDTPEKRAIEKADNPKVKNRKKFSMNPVVKKGGSKSIKFDESDHDDASDFDEQEEQLEDLELPGAGDLKPDDFILVKFNTKKTQVLYAGQIHCIYPAEDEDESSFGVRFLRRKTPKTFTFVFPTVNDTSDISYEDIMGRLPKPLEHGGTARVARHLIFPVDLDCYSDVLR